MEAKTHTHTHTHTVTLQYLGRVVLKEDNDTPAVHHNIKRLSRRGTSSRRCSRRGRCRPTWRVGMFYQAVVASILLYDSKSWVVSPLVMRELEDVHVEAARRLTGMCPRKVKCEWVYPHSADVLAATHLRPNEYYI